MLGLACDGAGVPSASCVHSGWETGDGGSRKDPDVAGDGCITGASHSGGSQDAECGGGAEVDGELGSFLEDGRGEDRKGDDWRSENGRGNDRKAEEWESENGKGEGKGDGGEGDGLEFHAGGRG